MKHAQFFIFSVIMYSDNYFLQEPKMKIYNISQNQLNTVKLQNKQQTQNFACSPIKRSQPQEQASKILANYNKALVGSHLK